MHQVIDVVEVLGDEVDAPQASVGVGSGEGEVAVREVVARDEVAEPAGKEGRGTEGAVPVPEDALEDEHGEVVGRAPADTLDGDGDVRGAHRVVPHAHFGADKGGFGGVGGPPERDGVGGDGEGGEVRLGELDELGVRDAACPDEHHAVSSVVRLDVVR